MMVCIYPTFSQVYKDVVVGPADDIENSEKNGPEAVIGEDVRPMAQRHLRRRGEGGQDCEQGQGSGS